MKNAIQVRIDELETKIRDCSRATFLGRFGREPVEFEKKCIDSITRQLSKSLEAEINLSEFGNPEGLDTVELLKFLTVKGYAVDRFNNKVFRVKVCDKFIQTVLTYDNLRRLL